MSTHRAFCAVVALLMSAAAYAQPGPGEWGERRGPWFERMFDRIAADLGLDEAQRARYDALIEARQPQLDEMRQQWEVMREQRMQEGFARRGERGFGPGPGFGRGFGPGRGGFGPGRGPMFGGPMGGVPGEIVQEVLHEMTPELSDEQLQRVYQMEDRFQQQRERGEQIRRLTQDLPADLQLDDAQQEAFEELLAERRAMMGERFREMRELGRTMREAEDGGDLRLADEIRQQMAELRVGDPSAMAADFLDSVAEFLHPEQMAALEQYRAEFVVPPGERAGAARDRGPDLRNVLRAARRVRLDDAQREALREIEREAQETGRQLRRTDNEGHAALAERVRAQVRELLAPDQVESYEMALARLERR